MTVVPFQERWLAGDGGIPIRDGIELDLDILLTSRRPSAFALDLGA